MLGCSAFWTGLVYSREIKHFYIKFLTSLQRSEADRLAHRLREWGIKKMYGGAQKEILNIDCVEFRSYFVGAFFHHQKGEICGISPAELHRICTHKCSHIV